jgi:hypothetical protein
VLSDEYLERLDHWAKSLAQHAPQFRPSARSACGNRDAGTTVAALSASPRAFRPRPSRDLRISDVLTWDYREALLERLRRRNLLPERYETYKTRQRQKIAHQVRGLVGALERGDTLWLAPEGMITQDGAPRRVRESLYDLLAMLPAGVRILPANVTYDFMTTGRMRACVSIGAPLQGLATLERGDLGKVVIAAMTGQTVVTMSMLGSRFLWERLQRDEPVFTLEAARATLAQNMLMLAQQGVTLEQGLRDARRAQRRLRAFLAYGLRHGLLSRQPDGAYRVHPAPFQQQRESFFWLYPRYPVNELLALEAARA